MRAGAVWAAECRPVSLRDMSADVDARPSRASAVTASAVTATRKAPKNERSSLCTVPPLTPYLMIPHHCAAAASSPVLHTAAPPCTTTHRCTSGNPLGEGACSTSPQPPPGGACQSESLLRTRWRGGPHRGCSTPYPRCPSGTGSMPPMYPSQIV